MKTKAKIQRVRAPTQGRFAPLAQASLLGCLLSFSFEFTFNLNFQKIGVAVTSPKNLAERVSVAGGILLLRPAFTSSTHHLCVRHQQRCNKCL